MLEQQERQMVDTLNQTRMSLIDAQQEIGAGGYGPRNQKLHSPAKVSPVKVFRPSGDMLNMSRSMMGDDINDRMSFNKSFHVDNSAKKQKSEQNFNPAQSFHQSTKSAPQHQMQQPQR